MREDFIFDRPYAQRFVDARQEWLRKFLPQLKQRLGLRTAVDIGCGVGYFSAFLREMGFDVVGVDGRQENVEEARHRHAGMEFRCMDVEARELRDLGSFDLVFCFGLVYHLENPLSALRNFAAMSSKVVLVEGICAPGAEAYFLLRQEDPTGDDNSLTALALYPSEPALIKAAYRMGFRFVAKAAEYPDHEDFCDSASRKRLRTILAASTVPLESPFFKLVEEPQLAVDPWMTGRAKLKDAFARVAGFARLSWPDKMRVMRKKLGARNKPGVRYGI